MIGNRGISRLLSRSRHAVPRVQAKCACGGSCPGCRKLALQPKLAVSSPNDAHEQEADRVADHVMSAPETLAQRMPAAAPRITPLAQSSQLMQEEPVVEDLAVPSLEALERGGQRLPDQTRSFFESRMGRDFGNVRVHTGNDAHEMAGSIHAVAFTHANHIVFAAGQYEPDSPSGRRLLAHELTHTVQQGGAGELRSGTAALQRSVVPSGPTPGGELPLPAGPAPAPATPPAVTPPAAGGTPTPCPTHGDLSKVPAMFCPVSTDPMNAGTSVMFAHNSSDLTPAAQATISAVAAAWHAGGGAGVLRIDGYASVEGPDELNWNLACARGFAVWLELLAPTDGSPGVPFFNLSFPFAHGETTEFSCTSLPPNRRAVITTSGGAPAPGPPCPLTIAGPHDVDHYCAAYVPSDATSCGVFPAPNITLTAAGGAPGKTLTWSIVRGTANAAIVGPATGASISIQGTQKSAATNDVTVQLTDGTCTITYLLTVHEPTSMPATTVATTTPTFVQLLVTYTVRDQFGNAMIDGPGRPSGSICWDETVTPCKGPQSQTGDVPINAAGQVIDQLRSSAVMGPGLCRKHNQIITVGGCGPLAQNTIVFQQSGATLNQGSSCTAGAACP